MAEEQPDVQLCEESPDDSASQPQDKQINVLLTFYSDHNMYKKTVTNSEIYLYFIYREEENTVWFVDTYEY